MTCFNFNLPGWDWPSAFECAWCTHMLDSFHGCHGFVACAAVAVWGSEVKALVLLVLACCVGFSVLLVLVMLLLVSGS